MRSLLNVKVWLGLCLAAFFAPITYGACTYSISPTNRSHGYGATTNSLTVNATNGCSWNVTNLTAWITILSGSNGTGTGTVSYAVAANSTINSRSGVLTIEGQTFSVQQDGIPCTYSVSPSSTTRGNAGVSNNPSFTVSSPTGCAWSLLNTSVWINFTGITNSTGTNTVTYSVAANRTPVERTGTVAIVGSTFTVIQHAAPCIYELSPTNTTRGFGTSTGTGTVTITSSPGNCDWYVNNTNSWISITANPSGNGSGTFQYSLTPNPNSTSRTGFLSVWNETLKVIQNPAPCSYSLTPTSTLRGADQETNVVTVNAVGGCPWSVMTNTNSWITFVLPTNGVGNGTVTYITAMNPLLVGRTGVVSIAGQNFTVRQDAGTCTYDLSPPSHIHGYGAVTSSVSLDTLSVCAWNVVNTNSWVTILSATNGVGDADINYALSQNSGGGDRTGVVLIGGQQFSLTQHGLGCAIDLSPTTRNHGYGVATNTIVITIAPGCSWNLVNSNSWITILDATNGTGSFTNTYSVTANPSSSARSGFVTINEGSVMISQSGAPCTFSLTPPSFTQSAGPQTNVVTVNSPIGCNWTINNTNSWITIFSDTNGSGSTGVIYQVAGHLNSASRTGLVTIAGQVFSVTQYGVICNNYKLSPTNRTHGYSATTNTISVTVSNPCPWSADSTNSWITILSGLSGTGTGTVTYAVSANSFSPDDRVGSIIMSGQICIITQHGIPCTYSVTPTTRTHGYGAASNSFNVTTTNGCAWVVGNTTPWVTITAGASGTASGAVGYTVDENTSFADRIAVLTVDAQTFTITQRSAVCSFDLTPTTRTHGYAATTNSIGVTTTDGCGWLVSKTNSWITILSNPSGTGTGVVTYSVASNINLTPRTGVIAIGDQNFIVNQSAYLCNYSLTPSTRTHGFGAASNSFLVSTTNGCTWSIGIGNPWITILAGATGTNNGTVDYAVSANTNVAERIGQLNVNGETFTITQRAAGCAFDLSPTTRNHGSVAGTNAFSVSTAAGCDWPVSTTNSWITVLSGPSGTGAGTVTYSVAPNASGVSRTGIILVGGESFVVKQSTNICAYTLFPTTRTHGYGAASNVFFVAATNGCSWSVGNANSWITLTSGASGVNNGTVTYSVAANTNFAERIAQLTVNGETFTITQRALLCPFDLTPSTRTHGYGAATNTVSVDGTVGCVWPVTTTNSWISVLSSASGTGTGTVIYAVASNTNFTPRTGAILIGDQSFVVNQSAYLCTYKLSPTNTTRGFGANTGSVNIVTGPNCDWAISTTNTWITLVPPVTGVGNATFTYTIAPNNGSTTRTGVVMLADQVLTIAQLAATDGFAFESVRLDASGAVTLKLNGGPPGIWELQSCLDMTNWTKVANLTNTTGRVEYTIPGPTSNARFYRAVLP